MQGGSRSFSSSDAVVTVLRVPNVVLVDDRMLEVALALAYYSRGFRHP